MLIRFATSLLTSCSSACNNIYLSNSDFCIIMDEGKIKKYPIYPTHRPCQTFDMNIINLVLQRKMLSVYHVAETMRHSFVFIVTVF